MKIVNDGKDVWHSAVHNIYIPDGKLGEIHIQPFMPEVECPNSRKKHDKWNRLIIHTTHYLSWALFDFMLFSEDKSYEAFRAYKFRIMVLYRKIGCELSDKLKKYLLDASYEEFLQEYYDFGN